MVQGLGSEPMKPTAELSNPLMLLIAATLLLSAMTTSQDPAPKTVTTVTLPLSTTPIQCLPALDEKELERRISLNLVLRKTIGRVMPIDDGYEVSFPRPKLLELVEWIGLERRCCPFLTFELVFLPDEGGVLLRIVGGEGVRDFLAATFFPDAPRNGG